MICPTCEQTNPAAARFCIYCSAQLTPTMVQEAQAAPAAPAIGPTTRLPQEAVPAYTMPAPAPIPVPATPHVPASIHKALPFLNEGSGAIFLIGLGVLFLTGNFWPSILLLIGITGFISEAGRGRQNNGLSSLIFFGGLTFLFWTGAFFPGILILLGILALVNSRRGFCW